jgi:ADP-heptose:LPS heptosyltransferase
VAVLRALKLGDLLCAVPALRSIRAALPNAEIVLIGLPWAREFAARFAHLVDGFWEFPGWPGLPEIEPRLDRIPFFLADMQAARFDLAVQLHGSGRYVNEVVALFGARHTAGFFAPHDYRAEPALSLPWPDRGPEVRRLLALTEFLGFPTRGEHLEFPLRETDSAAARAATGPGPGDYACVHPGASVADRRWPADRFAAVATALAAAGLRVVLTGTAAEAGLTRAVAAETAAPVVDLAGKTDLGATAAVVAGARLVVSNDTGMSHIAAAVRTPSVVISTGDNPARWAPADAARHRVLCRPEGLVPAGDVIDHALDLFGRVPAPVGPPHARAG